MSIIVKITFKGIAKTKNKQNVERLKFKSVVSERLEFGDNNFLTAFTNTTTFYAYDCYTEQENALHWKKLMLDFQA